MTEADVIQPSASIASTGFGIRYIGNWAYAYSGTVLVGAVKDVSEDILNFVSGSGLITARFNYSLSDTGGNDFLFTILFNDIEVFQYYVEHGAADRMYTTDLHLIIPPFTHVVCEASNRSASAAKSNYVAMTGRVYGAT